MVAAVSLVDPRQNRAFRGHYRLDIEAGHELDIVHGEDVRRIDHRDGQRCAHAAQRKNLVAFCGLERNQLDDGRVNFEVGKIDGRNAILARKEICDVLIREEAELHQGGAQAAALLLLHLIRLFQLLWGNDLLFDEKVTQPLRHTQISYPRRWNDASHLCRHERKRPPIHWERRQLIRVDINCQRKRITAPLTLVLGLAGGSCVARGCAALNSAPNAVFAAN